MTYGHGVKLTRISENGRIPSPLVQVRPSLQTCPRYSAYGTSSSSEHNGVFEVSSSGFKIMREIFLRFLKALGSVSETQDPS